MRRLASSMIVLGFSLGCTTPPEEDPLELTPPMRAVTVAPPVAEGACVRQAIVTKPASFDEDGAPASVERHTRVHDGQLLLTDTVELLAPDGSTTASIVVEYLSDYPLPRGELEFRRTLSFPGVRIVHTVHQLAEHLRGDGTSVLWFRSDGDDRNRNGEPELLTQVNQVMDPAGLRTELRTLTVDEPMDGRPDLEVFRDFDGDLCSTSVIVDDGANGVPTSVVALECSRTCAPNGECTLLLNGDFTRELRYDALGRLTSFEERDEDGIRASEIAIYDDDSLRLLQFSTVDLDKVHESVFEYDEAGELQGIVSVQDPVDPSGAGVVVTRRFANGYEVETLNDFGGVTEHQVRDELGLIQEWTKVLPDPIAGRVTLRAEIEQTLDCAP